MKLIEDISTQTKELSYYENESINSTGIGWFEKSPLHYHKMTTGKFKTDTKYTQLGTAVHSAVITPEKFNENYILGKDKIDGKMGTYAEAYIDVLIGGGNEEMAHEIAYIKSDFKWDPEKVIAQFEKDDVKKYVRFLSKSFGKTV